MNVILHMGIPKTGTTALQNALASSADILREAGFFFEEFPYTSNHVVFLQRERQRFAETCRVCGDDGWYIVSEEQMYIYPVHNLVRFLLSNGRENILTIERYRSLRNKFLKKLSDVYAGNTVCIVVYLRRQDLLLESWIKQIIKTLKVRVPLNKMKDYLIQYCDYEMNLDMICSAFPDAKMIVRIYDKKSLVGGNSIADFAAYTHTPIPEKYFSIKKNKSHSWDAMLMKLSYDRYARGKISMRDARYLLDTFDFVRKKQTISLFSQEERCNILKFFEQSNNEVAQRWLGKDILFDMPAAEDSSGASSLETSEQIGIFAEALESILDDVTRSRRPLRRSMRTIRESGLFDEEFYRNTYVLGREERYAPLEHFLLFGAEKGYQPNPDFHTMWYIQQHPEISACGVNPLIYHILVGREKNFPTSPEGA